MFKKCFIICLLLFPLKQVSCMEGTDKSKLTFENLGLLGENFKRNRSKSVGYEFSIDLINEVRELGDRLSVVSERQDCMEMEIESVSDRMAEWVVYVSRKMMPDFPKHLNMVRDETAIFLDKASVKVYNSANKIFEIHECYHNEVAWLYCFIAICGAMYMYDEYIRVDRKEERGENMFKHYGVFALKGLGVIGASVLAGEVVVGLLGLKLKWI